MWAYSFVCDSAVLVTASLLVTAPLSLASTKVETCRSVVESCICGYKSRGFIIRKFRINLWLAS